MSADRPTDASPGPTSRPSSGSCGATSRRRARPSSRRARPSSAWWRPASSGSSSCSACAGGRRRPPSSRSAGSDAPAVLTRLRRIGLRPRAWAAPTPGWPSAWPPGACSSSSGLAKREPKVVYREQLQAGPVLVISHLPPAPDPRGHDGTRHEIGPLRGRRQGAGRRQQEPPLPGHPARGRRVPHPRRRHRPTPRSSGQPEGTTLRSTSGARYLTLRPTLSDFVLSMPRGAQVVYPKDLGPLLMLADVLAGRPHPGGGRGVGRPVDGAAAGGRRRWSATSSGPTSPPSPWPTSTSFLGPDVDYRVEERDVYEGIDEAGLDRVVLDLPEPWRVVKHAEAALRPGGIFVSYLPTIGQVAQLHEALEASPFGLAQTIEVLQRSWHVAGPVGASRPPHGRPHRVPHLGPPPRVRGRGRAADAPRRPEA